MKIEFENVKTKGNSEDSLLVIYILRVLKKYSSAKNPLSSQDVMEYLEKDYSIGCVDKAEAQRKKVRRHLDTLHEFYGNGCIIKVEGKTRNGHKWFYDAKKDDLADENEQTREILSVVEIDFLVDMISASKIINSQSTITMVEKLLKKAGYSEKDRECRLNELRCEKWSKSINAELVSTRDALEFYIDHGVAISFDYEEKAFSATPCDVIFRDGKFILDAKVGNEYCQFLIEKIQNLKKTNDPYDFEDYYFDEVFDDGEKPDDTTLETLFLNIPIINDAIKKHVGIEFQYLSYAIDQNEVVLVGKDKRVLPRSLVFHDGKYYLIGYDEGSTKIEYYRVDLISDLKCSKTKIKISDWNERVLDAVRRSRQIEMHPFMRPGIDTRIDFLVLESALDRVVDAFGRSAQFEITNEERPAVKDLFVRKWNDDTSDENLPKEKVIKASVRTTRNEAFRWALANADAVELVYPPDLRYSLRRIADPIKRTYVKNIDDKVRRNVDWICETGTFNLTPKIGENNIGEKIGYESFKILDREGNSGVVNDISIWDLNADDADYLGSFKNAVWLEIKNSESREPKWMFELTDLLGLSIISTSIEDVSWMRGMVKLQGIELQKSPISDLSVISEHQDIFQLVLNEINISDIGFLEKYQYLQHLVLIGCPINDYSPLLRIPPLKHLEIDEKAVDALGMENLVKQHPDADIIVRQKITNRKD